MKNEIITVQTKNQGLLTYLKIENISNLPKLHHKLRVKQVIYGRLFHTYHNDMDFSNSNILIDNRI
jgi:hypothetical protein